MSRAAKRKRRAPDVDYDLGPQTAAQRALTVVEPVPLDANGRKRRRRLSVIEDMQRRGQIDKRQFEAAKLLQEAWERTMRSPPAIQEIRVDTFPSPDANVAIQIDRQSALVAVSRGVPQRLLYIVAHVVHDNRPVTALHPGMSGRRVSQHMDNLRAGLDALADHIEGRRAHLRIT